MLKKVYSGAIVGINSYLVTVEVVLEYKKHHFYIVGMGDTAIHESKKRILAAFNTNNIDITEREIAVNLAPADLRKEGSIFDFPIAVGILAAAGYIRLSESFFEETIFMGELSFDGSLRPVKGVLSLALSMHSLTKKRLIIPYENCTEASCVTGIEVIGIKSLDEFIKYSKGKKNILPFPGRIPLFDNRFLFDYKEVKGQQQAKRALQIAAAGYHNIIFIGPPGSGKTMLAQRLPTIMPPMSLQESLETSRIYSAHMGLYNNELIAKRPFRSPHHNISQSGLIGGGSPPQAGEISFAHNGILFLDELTEFRRSVIEALRQPLENKVITITRSQITIELPASFLLVAAMNPCPCGFLGDTRRSCHCAAISIYNYLSKISGPFLDRIDLQIFLHSLPLDELQQKESQSSQELYEKVISARQQQLKRFGNTTFNGLMSVKDIEEYCPLESEAKELLMRAFEKFKLSMRSYHKIIKVSRTIADLEESDRIYASHIKEALLYRGIDHKLELLKNGK